MEGGQGQIERIDFQESRGRRCYGRQRYRAWKSGRDEASRRPCLRRKAGAIAVLTLNFLLAGCSRERTETRREIERIQEAAESVAQERVAAYIFEKYGMKATAEGHWDRKGRPDMEDDSDSLLSDWKSGERSPVKVSLALMAGILALALVIVLQG